MNILRLLTRWGFIILIPILLLSGTIAWAFNSLWIYENGFVKYDVGPTLGISSAELNISASKLIDYFNDPHQEYLDINVTYSTKIHHLIERALISMISFSYKSKENGLGSNI